jgi:hypothetical protein
MISGKKASRAGEKNKSDMSVGQVSLFFEEAKGRKA